jgi:NADPH2:quinone reductase
MRALRIHQTGGPDSLVLDEVDEPAAQDGLVLIDVAAAGVGFVDLLVTKGEYQLKPELPCAPASECVGRRRDTGERVVAVSMFSALAEVAPAIAFAVFAIPHALSDDEAAGFLINYQTAHLALTRRGRLAPGETVLVHGAAGGVGSAAIQVAKALQAGTIIGVASSPDKRAAAISAGADHAVDGSADWVAEVKQLTAGRGVDVVVDPVGGDAFDGSLRCTAPFGRLLVIGFASGRIPELKVNRLLLRQFDVVGVNWGGLLPLDQAFAAAAHADLMRWHAEGHIAPLVGPVYDLADGAQAFRDLEARTATGKPVVRMR